MSWNDAKEIAKDVVSFRDNYDNYSFRWSSYEKERLTELGMALLDCGYCYKKQWTENMYELTEVDVNNKDHDRYTSEIIYAIEQVWERIPNKQKIKHYYLVDKILYYLQSLILLITVGAFGLFIFLPASHYTLFTLSACLIAWVVIFHPRQENHLVRNGLILFAIVEISTLIDYVYFNNEWDMEYMNGVEEKFNLTVCLLYNCLIPLSMFFLSFGNPEYIDNRRKDPRDIVF